MKCLTFLACVCFSLVTKAQNKFSMDFRPADSTYSNDAKQYAQIWQEEGQRIIEAMERLSGMHFIDKKIIANILETGSNSGYPNGPMTLRASYDYDTKKGTIVHELGHRLHFSLNSKKYPRDINDHEILFLYLYDVWVELYSVDFANKMVTVESKRVNPRNNYKLMWENALAMSKEERKMKLKEFVEKIGFE